MAVMAPTANGGIAAGGPRDTTLYGWIVFALSFGLLISDYMARQVLNAVFPLLKAEWALSDAELGLLSGVVALMVGLLTFPLSLAADRWGRVRSLAIMAAWWSVRRIMVGVGEAAYGSVGIAVVISVFPQRLRATLSAAFMAGGLFGQVLGVAIGGEIAASHGWRAAFAVIGLGGLLLAVAYPLVVREKRIAEIAGSTARTADTSEPAPRTSLRALFANRSVRLAYCASGVQLVAAGTLPAWLPSYFNRYYAMPVDAAGRMAALFLLICGCGMVICDMASDRTAQGRPDRKILLASGYGFGSAIALTVALMLPPGLPQLVLLGIAMFFVAGTTGPAGAMVANLTPPRSTVRPLRR